MSEHVEIDGNISFYLRASFLQKLELQTTSGEKKIIQKNFAAFNGARIVYYYFVINAVRHRPN